MSNAQKERAQRYADNLLGRYTPAELSPDGLRDLIAIAWLEGHLDGADIAVQAITDQLARVSA